MIPNPLLRAYANSLFALFVLFVVYVPVNSYGHVETISKPNHTFSSRASLIKQLPSTLYTY